MSQCKYGVNIVSNNINAILRDVQMTDKFKKELNSDSFRKYMASMDAKLAYNNQNQQVGMQ